MRRILMVLLLLWPATAMAGVDLSVDVRTDYLPQFDFDFVRVELESLSNPAEVIPPVDTPVLEDDPAVAGVRAADFFDLGGGDYWATVSLRDDAGNLVAERNVSLTLNADFTVTTVLARPDSVHLTQRDDLIFDADGDGEAGPGDVVRYDIRIFGPSEAGLFRDVLRAGSALIPGSVRTSPHGQVLVGNGAGHQDRHRCHGDWGAAERGWDEIPIRLDRISLGRVYRPGLLQHHRVQQPAGHPGRRVLLGDPDPGQQYPLQRCPGHRSPALTGRELQ